MAKNVATAFSSVKNFIEKLPLTAPWKIAGPIVSKEWKPADLDVSEYRLNAPGQLQQEPPIIPRTTPDKVYDIKYWTRDTKREHMLVGGTNKKFQEISWVEVGPSVVPEPFVATPPARSEFRTFKTKRKPLLEVTNDGYE